MAAAETAAARPPAASPQASADGHGAVPSRFLPYAEHMFISDHGPEGRALLAGLRNGEPDAFYRAGLLLVSEPGFAQTGRTLLIDAASGNHEGALEVLDAGHVDQAVAGRLDPDLARRAPDQSSRT